MNAEDADRTLWWWVVVFPPHSPARTFSFCFFLASASISASRYAT